MAGKAKRAAAADKRMKLRRAKKAQRAAEYATKTATAKKTPKKGVRVFSIGKHKHLMARCGNVGCMRCNKTLNIEVNVDRLIRAGFKGPRKTLRRLVEGAPTVEEILRVREVMRSIDVEVEE